VRVFDESVIPQDSEVMTGRPEAIASRRTRGIPSMRDGRTKFMLGVEMGDFGTGDESKTVSADWVAARSICGLAFRERCSRRRKASTRKRCEHFIESFGEVINAFVIDPGSDEKQLVARPDE